MRSFNTAEFHIPGSSLVGSPKPAVTVSVIIPAFNRARYIGAAVSSITRQSLRDIEIIVVDDGSTDATADVAQSCGDPRVCLVRHDRNQGIPAARNTGLREARGRYIAWLDSDDVAHPQRLAEQVAFLERHPSIALVGACAGKIGPDGTPRRGVRVPPLTPEDIGAWLLFRSAFQQSSITGRAEVLKAYEYDTAFPVSEDIDVLIRLERRHRLQSLPRILIDRRIHPQQTIRERQADMRATSRRLFAVQLERLGMSFSDDDLERHILLGKPWFGGFQPDRDYLAWADDWMRRLRDHNLQRRLVSPDALGYATAFFWMLACNAARHDLGAVAAARIFARSQLTHCLLSEHPRTQLLRALSVRLGPRPIRSRADGKIPVLSKPSEALHR